MTATETLVSSALTAKEAEHLDIIEALFFAYRDFISDPDEILDQLGFGRAHHRVVYFVNRKPGLTVAELLDILKITKQSLARVLKQLIETGYVEQVQGVEDRRQRELFPTRKGRQLALTLSAPQSRRISEALKKTNAGDREAIVAFLTAMANSKA